MQEVCTNTDFFRTQAMMLRKSIEEDKWLLSEKAGRDVGWDYAEKHFIETYFSGFAAGFRAAFCSLACPLRDNCVEGQKWL